MTSNEFTRIYFEQFGFLTDEDREKLMEIARMITYPANKVVMYRGEKVSQVGIIVTGLIRAFDKNDKTVWLFPENKVYGSMDVLAFEHPSSLTYETLEQTTILLFDYEELENLMCKYPNIGKLLLTYWKTAAVDIYHNFYSLFNLTPEKRYLQLLGQNSKLALRVKSKDLATYLGIHPVSLSRLKKRYFNPK